MPDTPAKFRESTQRLTDLEAKQSDLETVHRDTTARLIRLETQASTERGLNMKQIGLILTVASMAALLISSFVTLIVSSKTAATQRQVELHATDLHRIEAKVDTTVERPTDDARQWQRIDDLETRLRELELTQPEPQ